MEKAAKRESVDDRPGRPAKAARHRMPPGTEQHNEATAAPRVLIHRIEDDGAGDDAVGTVEPVRPRAPRRTATLPYAGSVAANRTRDVRPPYNPPYALRQAIERAREAQPRLLSMAGGETEK